MKPEERVKHKVKALLKTFGDKLYYCMPRGTVMGTVGVPDFLICWKGRMIGVETKANAKCPPTPMQARNHEQIRAAGGAVFVIHDENLHELADYLRSL